jgi:hypothetical protein
MLAMRLAPPPQLASAALHSDPRGSARARSSLGAREGALALTTALHLRHAAVLSRIPEHSAHFGGDML